MIPEKRAIDAIYRARASCSKRGDFSASPGELVLFVAQVIREAVAAEREAIAEMVDTPKDSVFAENSFCRKRLATAIRARGAEDG